MQVNELCDIATLEIFFWGNRRSVTDDPIKRIFEFMLCASWRRINVFSSPIGDTNLASFSFRRL